MRILVYVCRDKQQKPLIMFAAAKIRVRMISTFSRRKLSLTNQISVFLYTSLSVFKMEDIEEQELNSNVSNNEIVNETSQSQPPDNFDKGMFLEEVQKYRCLWDINNKSYKIRSVKQNAWLQIASVFNRDGKHCTQYLRPFFKIERHLCSVLAVLTFKNFFARA